MNEVDFQEALALHKDRVFRHSLYLLFCQEDAEDATQEAFLRLWRDLRKVERSRAGFWLMRTVHRLSIDLLRRRQTIRRQLGTACEDGAGAVGAAKGRILDPASRLDHSRRQERLLEAMEILSPQARSMLLLHYNHGYAYTEVAEIVEMSEAAVRVAVHRARKKLRRLLERTRPGGMEKRWCENALQ